MVCLEVVGVIKYVYNNGKLLNLRYTEDKYEGFKRVVVEYTVGVKVEDPKYVCSIFRRRDIDYHVLEVIRWKYPDGEVGYVKEFNKLSDLRDLELAVVVSGVRSSDNVVMMDVHLYGEETERR